MIRALVNGSWKAFENDQLQPGTNNFGFEGGLYETFRTMDHQPIFLVQHLDRLFESAESMGLKPHFQRYEIETMIDQVIKEFPDPEQRARILLVPGKIIIYTTPLDLDHNIYSGVSVISIPAQRKDPHIKTTDYSVCLNAYEIAQDNNCFDAILIDEDDQVFEGSRSNVFWVKNNDLYTREKDVLPGITRQMIIMNSPHPVNYSKLKLLDLGGADEVFLTNSGSGIIPVVKVNNTQIGVGNPGPITMNLLDLYPTWMNNES